MNTCCENRSLWFCASTTAHRALGHCAMVLQVFPAVLTSTACASPSVHVAFPSVPPSHSPKLSREYYGLVRGHSTAPAAPVFGLEVVGPVR